MVCFCHFHGYSLVGIVHIQSNIYIYNGQFQDEGVFFSLTIYSMCNIIGITSLWKVYSILHFCVTHSFHVEFRKGFKNGEHGAYLAKAAFSQYLVEY